MPHATDDRAMSDVGCPPDRSGTKFQKYLSQEATLARKLLQQIHKRNECFDQSLVNETAWEMMLEAFACREEGRRNTMSGLCYVSKAPLATAARNLNQLVQNGLMVREPDKKDRRRHWVDLSDEALFRMRALIQHFPI